MVLNGNGVSGAAAQVASLVRARGYQVTGSATRRRRATPGRSSSTAPHYRAEALRFRRDLQPRPWSHRSTG